jgi:hypothetical protein
VSDSEQKPKFLAGCVNGYGLFTCGITGVIFTGCKWCKVNDGQAHVSDCSPVNSVESKESVDVLGQPFARGETARLVSQQI